jgi:alpha-D-xyloside xylohydrolase
MMCVLRGMLSMALSGFAYYTSDIGGFIGGPPSEKLFVRWTQFGLLSPISRFHGIGAREPYAFGKTAAAVASEFGALRERLRPYLVALAEEAEKTGMPLARPMCLEFPEDRTCRSLDLQYMLGPGLLVAPVFREDDTVEYYLPAGEWTDWWSGKTIPGGSWRKEKVALDRMPLWIRNERLTKELAAAR